MTAGVNGNIVSEFFTLLLFALTMAAAHAQDGCEIDDNSERRGFWHYSECETEEPDAGPEMDEPVPEYAAPPPLPSRAELMTMHPLKLKELIDEHLNFAIWKQTPEAAEDYYTLTDIARRKAAGFTALSKFVMMTNPELNARSQYAVTQEGRNVSKRNRKERIRDLLSEHRSDFALVMFSQRQCDFCRIQLGTLKLFQDSHGWPMAVIDRDENPEQAARHNVSITPYTIIIEKESGRWLPVSVGAEPLPDIENGVYRAVRYLKGDINEQQYITDENDQGGFFDPDAFNNGG